MWDKQIAWAWRDKCMGNTETHIDQWSSNRSTAIYWQRSLRRMKYRFFSTVFVIVSIRQALFANAYDRHLQFCQFDFICCYIMDWMQVFGQWNGNNDHKNICLAMTSLSRFLPCFLFSLPANSFYSLFRRYFCLFALQQKQQHFYGPSGNR